MYFSEKILTKSLRFVFSVNFLISCTHEIGYVHLLHSVASICDRVMKRTHVRCVKNVDRLPARIITLHFVNIVQSRHKLLHASIQNELRENITSKKMLYSRVCLYVILVNKRFRVDAVHEYFR